MRKHQRTRKHRRALRRQRTAEAALKANRRIDDNPKAKDLEKERLISLFETALFLAKSDAPIEMYVDLVRHLAQCGTPGFPKSGYGSYYTMEALAAEDAAKALPELSIIDAVIRSLAEDLGRSKPYNHKFKELQEVFTHTNLEVQGIHSVRWLSRGDAIARFVRVLPAVIVLLEETDATMYQLVTSFKFQFFLFFLADVHTALNALNLLFQKRHVDLTGVHSQVRRTIIYIEQRYLHCGQQFGGWTSELLSAFLARHALPDCREVTMEGVDKEGQRRVHKFQLHEESVKGYTTSSGDMQGCYTCCRSFARELVYNLELRLGDLTRLNGAKLFMPRSWPRGAEARDAECKEHLSGLVHLFQAKNRDTILPGAQKNAARAELRTFLPVLSTAPKEEQPFHAVCWSPEVAAGATPDIAVGRAISGLAAGGSELLAMVQVTEDVLIAVARGVAAGDVTAGATANQGVEQGCRLRNERGLHAMLLLCLCHGLHPPSPPSAALPPPALKSAALPSSGLHSVALTCTALPSPALPSSALPSPALPSSALPSPALPSSALPSPAHPSSPLPFLTPPSPTPSSPALAFHRLCSSMVFRFLPSPCGLGCCLPDSVPPLPFLTSLPQSPISPDPLPPASFPPVPLPPVPFPPPLLSP
ncbi:unnamed protein product [Closterium sp. Naga37s-1]|nr:unnamed protein product [Closterium sp. Naga37s-1]